MLLLVGCQYTPPGGEVPTDGTTTVDVTIIPDTLPDPNICQDTTTASCLGNVLRKCETVGQLPIDTPCAICAAGPPAHCEALVPSANGATVEDLAPDGNVVDITIGNDTRADTSSGEIQGVRPGGEGVLNGIGFRVVNNIAVWRFHSLVIDGDIDFVGNRPAVFAANRTIAVNDTLDLRGDCLFQSAGPGGSQGGIAEQDGSGGDGRGKHGNGASNSNASGGSGAGHGATGSGGASSSGNAGTTGGNTFGDATITMLRGGAGGGGGGGETTTGGIGGGGGGALHLVANDRITFGPGGGVNAGGCGGQRALFHDAAGGGGGSGGTILVEAIEVNLTTGILAVNGGGGGGGDGGGQAGQRGQLSRTAATGGGANGTTGGAGGAGGAPTTNLSGGAGASGSSNRNGGGGGGGVGRIRVNTRNDQNLIGTCAVCSPNFDDPGTTTTRGPATIITVD